VHERRITDAIRQTKDYTWQLLARPQCRLALNLACGLKFIMLVLLANSVKFTEKF